MSKIRTYSELIALPTFEERFRYLSLHGNIGSKTFGRDRYLNQILYGTSQWKRLRSKIIVRDNGCDLAVPGYDLEDYKIVIHHMNPITPDDILYHSDTVIDPEFLICVSDDTHRAIHYGKSEDYLRRRSYVERKPGDTKLW